MFMTWTKSITVHNSLGVNKNYFQPREIISKRLPFLSLLQLFIVHIIFSLIFPDRTIPLSFCLQEYSNIVILSFIINFLRICREKRNWLKTWYTKNWKGYQWSEIKFVYDVFLEPSGGTAHQDWAPPVFL